MPVYIDHTEGYVVTASHLPSNLSEKFVNILAGEHMSNTKLSIDRIVIEYRDVYWSFFNPFKQSICDY
ncbi:hypothetical protein P4S95_26195 [Aneurinibacillus aneurinilyticus]|uniref:hypothetical protein n=1 Tax=Aneurinibacillus aneurinilyticus TaxID=1391 RepID=UPI002E2458FC|nr:hypothetical protein [Aneurinibacillus aneurinilyticus]